MIFEKYEANAYMHNLDLLNHLVLITCFLSYKKWVLRGAFPNNMHLDLDLLVIRLSLSDH